MKPRREIAKSIDVGIVPLISKDFEPFLAKVVQFFQTGFSSGSNPVNLTDSPVNFQPGIGSFPINCLMGIQ